MKKLYFVMILVFVCSISGFAGSGNTSGVVLLEPLGARSIGLSGACSSLSGDVTFLHYNPASLSDLKIQEISLLYYNSGTTGINYGSITYGQSVGFGNAAISVAYLNAGEMDLNFIDGSTATVISESDIIGSVSIGIPLGDKLSIGASAKALYSTLVGSKSALGIGGDAGIRYSNFMLEGLNVGVSVLNIGMGLKYLDTTEGMPMAIQGGASYMLNNIIPDLNIMAALDGVYLMSDKLFEVRTGIEGSYKEFSGRIGMPFNSTDDASFTVGVGYKLDEFLFDYGAVFGKALGLTHRISMGMKFGDVNADEVKPKQKKNGNQKT